jgi:hypothetical protein
MNVLKYSAIYGLLSGTVIILVIMAGLVLGGGHGSVFGTMWFGYLVMLAALTFIFVGVKRYRDVERGGVIKFFQAFGLGLAIAAMAGVAYVLVWEIYLALTHYHFMDEYAAQMVAAAKAKGVSGEALAKKIAEMDAMRAQYANPLFRLPMSFMEIFPVGFLVALVSAALLRNQRFLPATR